ncbi:MAG: class I SAM-dependent methyltransferase [Planctomycetaceae bacterium]|nr:class I SAM-dependent methyltransferase [Planctomycetaceae bacterium]
MDAPTIDLALFHNLSVYQDVRIAGRTVLKGARDCEGRWNAIAPYLSGGVLLDVGANFGWFGLRWCETFETGQVVSVEADERSATVQQAVLAANQAERIFLLTAKANAHMAQRWIDAGQRFDAVLLFSILHWIRDHRALLEGLARIAGRMFIEQPHPSESGAGDEQLRREIGPIGPYLGELFPDRSVVHLTSWASHRECEQPRELWMVGEPAGWQPTNGSVDRATLLDLEPAWPPRSWWQRQSDVRHLTRQLAALPEHGVLTPRRRLQRGVRKILGSLRRWF